MGTDEGKQREAARERNNKDGIGKHTESTEEVFKGSRTKDMKDRRKTVAEADQTAHVFPRCTRENERRLRNKIVVSPKLNISLWLKPLTAVCLQRVGFCFVLTLAHDSEFFTCSRQHTLLFHSE